MLSVWYHAPFFAYTVLFHFDNRECTLSSSLFRWGNWGWARWSRLPQAPHEVSGQCRDLHSALCIRFQCLCLQPLSHPWALSQVLEMKYVVEENCGYGDLLCAPCLVQRPLLSHLLLTNTLQGQCHCPLFTGEKNRGLWVCQMSFSSWPVTSGPDDSRSGDSASEGLAQALMGIQEWDSPLWIMCFLPKLPPCRYYPSGDAFASGSDDATVCF